MQVPWFRGQGRLDGDGLPTKAHGTVEFPEATIPVIIVSELDKP